jgi:hypothetical protein
MHSLKPLAIERIWAEMTGIPVPAWHAFLYGFPEMPARAAFLWEDASVEQDEEIDATDGTAAELHWLVERVLVAGGDPIAVDITDEVAVACGCVVVRVVVPGFIALARGLAARPILNPRFVEVARKLGRSHRAPAFNQDPHPFP